MRKVSNIFWPAVVAALAFASVGPFAADSTQMPPGSASYQAQVAENLQALR